MLEWLDVDLSNLSIVLDVMEIRAIETTIDLLNFDLK